MTTKVIFNVDKKIKEKAMKVAKEQGLTLSYFLDQAVRAVAEKRLLGPVFSMRIDEASLEEKKVIRLGRKEIEKGKFSSSKDVFQEFGYVSKHTK